MNCEYFENYRYLGDLIIHLNANDNLFHLEFLKKFKEIESDIKSSARNLNCSCVDRVKDYVDNHRKKIAVFLFEYVEKYDIKKDLDKIEKFFEIEYIGGKVAVTSINEWKNFTSSLAKKEFRAFSVAKDGNDIYVFFV